MLSRNLRPRGLVPLYLAAMAALALLAGQVGYRQALAPLAQRGASELALAAASLTSQLQAYRELAVLIADHPDLRRLGTPAGRKTARAMLLKVADKTAALDVEFADRTGRVVVSARAGAADTVSAAPEFRRALQGALGTGHRRHVPDGRRGWYFAAPVFGPDHGVLGAVIVSVDVEDLEEAWRGGAAPVYFVDDRGEVFISNRSELVGWHRDAGGPGLAQPSGTAPLRVRNVAGHQIWRPDWGPYIPRRSLHLSQDLPVIGLEANILVDTAPARRLAAMQALAVAALCLALGMLLYLATERRRALARANAQLESRVAARTRALSDANRQLRREIAERQEAEAALKRAQADLVQAGKLSALGQMSAGISHELNQPLMAIQSFADNGTQFLDRDQPERARANLDRIADMARRMGRIVRNLRAFARQESAPAGRVDVAGALQNALDLLEPRLAGDRVAVRVDAPQGPVWVRGGEVRLAQVFVNLLGNAADAMAGLDAPAITVTIAGGEAPSVTVRDIGPGLDLPDKVFEPFYSTKAVAGGADGLGLGLSISYGIVQSFGGAIEGRNAPGGGAEFTVRLEPWVEEKAA
ncbi:MAG: sensor histidine kinase [Marinibacterium sp.]